MNLDPSTGFFGASRRRIAASGGFWHEVVFGTSLSLHFAPILRVALQRRYGEESEVINSGLPGKASRTALQALSERVLRHHPGAVMMEWAINDAHSYFHEPDALDAGISVGESRANLLLLIERVQNALPGCELLLWTTNPTFDAPHSSMRLILRCAARQRTLSWRSTIWRSTMRWFEKWLRHAD